MAHVMRIRYNNPQWDGRKILEGRRIIIRKIFYDIYRSIHKNRLIILTGPVGMGKTTLMYQLIDKLVEDGVNPRNILYVTLEDDICSVKEAMEYYEKEVKMKRIDGEDEEIYVFIDEASFDDNWLDSVNEYLSENKKIRFVISTSIKLPVKINRPHREFTIKPISFREYLEALGYEIEEIPFEKHEIRKKYIEYLDYSPFFQAYIRRGGYPGLIYIDDERYVRGWIKNNVIDRITYKIIPSLKGKKEAILAERLLRILAFEAGQPINYNSIAHSMNRDIRTVANYLDALQTAYIIKIVKNKLGTGRGSRKLPKVYMYTPGYAFSLYPERFNDNEYVGKLVEGLIAIHLDAKYYWKRGSKEVNILWDRDGIETPVVVKYVRRLTRREIKKVDTVLKKMDVDMGIIIVKDSLEFVEFDGRQVWIIPAWLFTLMV